MARSLALLAIKVYQRTLSPDHGLLRVWYPYGCCRFHPTCSMYGYGSIEQHGFLKGTRLALWRILRCHPFSKGGHDPVPR